MILPIRHSGESRNPVPLNSHIPYVVNSYQSLAVCAHLVGTARIRGDPKDVWKLLVSCSERKDKEANGRNFAPVC